DLLMDLLTLLLVFALVPGPSGPGTRVSVFPSTADAARSALDSELASARKACRENPTSVAALDRLASVLLRKYRLTHAAETVAAAEAAVGEALALDPRDFDARQFRVSIRLTN